LFLESAKEVKINEDRFAVDSLDDLETISIQETVDFVSLVVDARWSGHQIDPEWRGSLDWEVASKIVLNKIEHCGVLFGLSALVTVNVEVASLCARIDMKSEVTDTKLDSSSSTSI